VALMTPGDVQLGLSVACQIDHRLVCDDSRLP
jgi:hypothetical protein